MTSASPLGHTSWSQLRHGRSDQPAAPADPHFDLAIGHLVLSFPSKVPDKLTDAVQAA